MCTSSEQTLGKCAPSMAQTIISKCRRTWGRELRIGVLHRTLEPRLSVWDCVPENIIDAHLKDAFAYLPEQRDYILHYAIPGSAVVRGIRRLDGYRSSPLVLNSLRFCTEGEVDAYHFPQESDFILGFSKSEYGEESNISRTSTPSPDSVSEFEDNENPTIPQDDDSELDDGADRGKPEHWIDYSESGDVEICTSPQQSASDVDDEAPSPEPPELSIIWECDEELEDDQHDDEPAEANSPEPQQFSPVHHLDFDNDQQNDEPFEAESPKPRQPFPFRNESSVPDYDDEKKDDGSVEAESPEPRRLFPVHQFHSTEYDPPQPTPQMQTWCPAPLRRFLTPEERLKFDAFEDWFVRMSKRTPIDESSEYFISETPSPEPRRLFPFRIPKCDDDEKDDESLRSDSPEPRRLFPVHQFHSTEYDPPQPTPQMETWCPAPLRRFLTPEERLKFDAFEDWFVRMSERTPIDESSENSISETPSPEPRRLFPFRNESSVPKCDDDEKDDESLRSDSPEPRRLFPVHQFHSTEYDPPQPAPQMETWCPAPMRRFLTPEERLKFDEFEDWFVRMSECTAINASSEKSISETSSFPFRHETPVPEYENEEKDYEPESPEPRRLFPVHQFHSAVHEPPQPVPQMEAFCPGPLRRFLTPEETLKLDAFDNWFVHMYVSKRTDIDASLEKFISETSNPETKRFFPVQESHSWLNEPRQTLECDD